MDNKERLELWVTTLWSRSNVVVPAACENKSASEMLISLDGRHSHYLVADSRR